MSIIKHLIIISPWVGFWAEMVGAAVRSLLSDHKVSSSIPALPRFEYLYDLLFCLS